MSSPKVDDLVKEALKRELERRKRPTAPSSEPSLADEVGALIDEMVESRKSKMKEPAVVAHPKLKSNQKLFSELTGVYVRDEDDFGVTCFHDYEWDERLVPFIPEVDKGYVIEEEAASNILLAWELNEKVLCYGPTGAGKSSLIQQLCALTNRPFVRVNCTGDMDSSMIFGQLTAKDGSTIWVDGAVTEAVKYGAVFAWDEWDVTPPEISMGLQWLLEDNGKLFLKEMPGSTKDKQIVPHEHFRLVAIGNTQGQGDDTGSHAGTNVQNSATLDRFGTAVYINYLNPLVEEQMINNNWSASIAPKTTKELVKLANLIRQGYQAGQFNLTVSPRSLFSICRKMAAGYTLKKAYKVVYLNKLNETQRKVADELFNKVFGSRED